MTHAQIAELEQRIRELEQKVAELEADAQPAGVPANEHLTTLYNFALEYWAHFGPDEHWHAARRAIFALADAQPAGVPWDALRQVMEFVDGYVGECLAPDEVEFATDEVNSWLDQRPAQD